MRKRLRRKERNINNHSLVQFGWLVVFSSLTAQYVSVTGLQPPGHHKSGDCSAEEKLPSAARKVLLKHMSTEEGVEGKHLNSPDEACGDTDLCLTCSTCKLEMRIWCVGSMIHVQLILFINPLSKGVMSNYCLFFFLFLFCLSCWHVFIDC